MKIALVHDYLTQRGGAERVALAAARAFGVEVINTLSYEPQATFAEFQEYLIKASAIQKFGIARRNPQYALPLLPFAVEGLDVGDADVVFASSSGWAHGVRTAAPLIVYCHTPARWLYARTDFDKNASVAQRLAADTFGGVLRRWDQRAAARADLYIANSVNTQRAIKRAYGKDAEVVPPPPGLTAGGPESALQLHPGFLLTVGRQRGYKNMAAAIGAAVDRSWQLVIVGGATSNPEDLPSNVVCLPNVSDAQLRWLYRNCAGLIALAIEDFGLTPVEAASFGRPTVALRHGGYLETVVEGVTGVFVNDVESRTVAAGVHSLLVQRWQEAALIQHALGFSEQRFADRIRTFATQLASS